MEKTAYADHGISTYHAAQSFTSIETFKYDAMGNIDTSNTATSGSTGPAWETWAGGRKTRYSAGNGRVRAVQPPAGATANDTLWYDPAGNQHVLSFTGTPGSLQQDRVSYFDAEQRLRAVDFRTMEPGFPATVKKVVATFAVEKGTLKGTQTREKTVPAADGL